MAVLTIINIFLLIIMLILNINSYLFYLISLILLIFLSLSTYKKNISSFIFLSLAYIMSSLYLTINENYAFLLIIYYLIEVILLILFFRHTFTPYNNKLNLTFQSIKVPNNKEYLIGKYLSGPLKNINSNTLIKRLEDSLLIQVEDNKGEIEELKLAFNDIQKIDITTKPYYKTVKKFEHGNHDYITGHFESHPGIKIIKSYEIKIKTPKDEIILLSFNYPDILNNIKQKQD